MPTGYVYLVIYREIGCDGLNISKMQENQTAKEVP